MRNAVKCWSLVLLLSVVTWASPDEEKLLQKLMKNYHITTRPVLEPQDTLVFNLSFSLIDIKFIDIESNTMSVEGWLQLQWSDKQLRWIPAEHNNVGELHVPIESIWKPDLKTYNGLDAALDPTLAIVYKDGNVLWVPPYSATIRCNMNPLWYPFDTQTCMMKFGTWTHDVKMIDIQVGADMFKDFNDNKDWNLISVKQIRTEKKYDCCETPYPSIEVYVTVRRKACKIVLGQVLPVIMTTALALTTMLIPAHRADMRLLIITLLFGYIMIDTNYSDVPEAVSALTLLYGNLLSVFVGLFVCNCIHLAFLGGHNEPCLLSKFAVCRDQKSENPISSFENRYQRSFDTLFTFPLTLILTLGTVMFISIPLLG